MASNNDPRKQEQNDAAAPKTPSLGKTIAKIAIGACFIAVGLDDLPGDLSGFLIALIVGAALIAWGLIPYYQARQKEKQEEIDSILSKPIKPEEKDEAEKLAEKYTDK